MEGTQHISYHAREEIENLCSCMIEKAMALGAEGADVLYAEGVSNEISYKDGECEECTEGRSASFGLRTILPGGRQGIASSNRLDRNSALTLAEWSVNNARSAEPEEGITLFDGPLLRDEALEATDGKIAGITPEFRRECCLEMTAAAMAQDKRIFSVRSAAWSDALAQSYFATSRGLSAWTESASVCCSTVLLAEEDGDVQMGGYNISSLLLDEADAKKCAEKAVRDTVSSLGGRPVATGSYTAVIDREAAASLIDVIGDLFCASDVHKGRSMMKGRLGTPVASSCFTLVDDGRVPWRAGSSSWDSEGVQTQKTKLITAGIADSYLYNLQYALKDGVNSTGSCTRGLTSLPDIGTSNLIVAPGSRTFDNIMSDVSDGIYLTEFMGLHTIDTVSGDFSIGAKGIKIENGVLTTPVSTVTIASNLLDLLKNIALVGNDSVWSSTILCPTLVVENVVIAGN